MMTRLKLADLADEKPVRLTLELPAGSLPRASWVKISQVRTISVDRIGKRVGEVDGAELTQIVAGLTELIT